MSNFNKYDAIVIGSGIGGLTTAAILAKYNHQKVLILEQHYPISLTQNAIANPRSFTAYMFDPDVNSLLSNNSLWFEFQSASKSIKS